MPPSGHSQQTANHCLAQQDLTFLNCSGPTLARPVARNPGEIHHVLTPSFLKILVNSRINILGPVLLLRYAATVFIAASFGHPFGGLKLRRFKTSVAELSVSVKVEVPLVMKIRRGLEDLSSKEITRVIKTWVPEIYMSQEAFQASRIVMASDWIWLSYKAPHRTSSRPLRVEMISTAFLREASEARSTSTTVNVEEVEGYCFLTSSIAASPLESVRQPRRMS